jgi:hypothetical protein
MATITDATRRARVSSWQSSRAARPGVATAAVISATTTQAIAHPRWRHPASALRRRLWRVPLAHPGPPLGVRTRYSTARLETGLTAG